MAPEQIYGIIGNPVRQSLSPLIHNFLFEKYKINAHYHLFEIQENQLQKAIEGIRILGIKGVNVTAPFKEKVIPYLDEIKSEAKTIGAVNTIHNQRGRLIGYNTDIDGIKKTLQTKLKFLPGGKKIAVLGAGGAAKACIYTLLQYNLQELLIFNRNLQRAKELKQIILKMSKNTRTSFYPLRKLPQVITEEGVSLIINAVSGNNSLIQKTTDGILSESKNKTKVFDLKYHAVPQNQTSRRKSDFIDGTYMLVAQALESFYIWTRIKPEFNSALKLVSNYIRKGKYA